LGSSRVKKVERDSVALVSREWVAKALEETIHGAQRMNVGGRAVNSTRPGARQRRRALEGYLYLAPWIVGFLAFYAAPILISLAMSFSKYSVLAPPIFVGLENYKFALFGDELGISSFIRSFQYAGLAVPLGLAGSQLLAIALNQGVRLIPLWRTCFYLPTLTPGAAAAILWLWLLNPQVGVVNYLLSLVGITGPGWFFDTGWAIPSVVMVALFGSVGGATMIIFLAGLQSVPLELLDAAEIDGAGPLAKFRYVTVPMISPVLFFNLVVGIIASLNVFDTAWIATKGGPANATWFISLQIYVSAFRNFEMGYASALAWLLALVVFVLTFIQIRLSGRWVYYQGGGPEDVR
jgi:multiple sugar transport system permease protein